MSLGISTSTTDGSGDAAWSSTSSASHGNGVKMGTALVISSLPPGRSLPFVVTLEPARREVVDRALEEIAPLDFHVERPVCLPIVD